MAIPMGPRRLREKLDIVIADFVPLEKRRQDAFHPSAKAALTNPEELKEKNKLLRQEWKARCDDINKKLSKATDDIVRARRLKQERRALQGRYSASELDMLRLDVAAYHSEKLGFDPKKPTKADNKPALSLQGIDAEVKGNPVDGSIAVTKSDTGKLILRFHRTDREEFKDGVSGRRNDWLKMMDVHGSHPPPNKIRGGGKAFSSKAGQDGPKLSFLVTAYYTELYFYATGMEVSQLRVTQSDESSEPDTATTPSDAVDEAQVLTNIWESYDTQRSYVWFRAGELKWKKAWAHAHQQPIENAPSYRQDARILAALFNERKKTDPGLERVTEMVEWEFVTVGKGSTAKNMSYRYEHTAARGCACTSLHG